MKQVSSLKDDLLLKTKQNKKANKQTKSYEVRLRPEFLSLYYTSAWEGTSGSVFFQFLLKRNKKKEQVAEISGSIADETRKASEL